MFGGFNVIKICYSPSVYKKCLIDTISKVSGTAERTFKFYHGCQNTDIFESFEILEDFMIRVKDLPSYAA